MSDLLNQASLVMVPSGYKEDTVYSVVPSDGSGDLSFTRASNGTRVNSAGLVEVTPWNLLQYSNTFNNAIWTKGSTISVTSGQTGYDGSSNAWLLSKNAIQYPALGQSLVNSGFTTLSVYAKANTNTNICLFASSSPSNKYQDFNLSNGTLGTNASGVVNATITSVGNGWYFCVVTFNGNTTTSDIFPDIIDGANAGSIYIQNAQLNIGSTANPYFPTTDRLNVPRLTYQNGGGGCPSLLLEKQSTNVFTYSEQFDDASWVKFNSSISANTTNSPDGTQNADSLIENTSNTDHGFYKFAPTITTALGSVTISCFIKSNGRRVQIKNSYTTDASNFDLQNGVVVSNVGSGVGEIQNIGNGWYRCILKTTANASGNAGLTLSLLDNSNNMVYTGNGTSGVYIWGAQIEVSSYSTSYIATTSSSATRVVDGCSKTGISSLIGQTEGVVFLDFVFTNINDVQVILSLHDNSNNKRIEIWANSASIYGFIGGSSSFNMGPITGTSGTRYKMAVAYKSGSSAFYVNGTQIQTEGTTFTISLTSLIFNYWGGGYPPSAKVNELVIFPTRLTNAELASLTTI